MDADLEKEFDKAVKKNEFKKNVFQIIKAEDSAKTVKQNRYKKSKLQ